MRTAISYRLLAVATVLIALSASGESQQQRGVLPNEQPVIKEAPATTIELECYVSARNALAKQVTEKRLSVADIDKGIARLEAILRQIVRQKGLSDSVPLDIAEISLGLDRHDPFFYGHADSLFIVDLQDLEIVVLPKTLAARWHSNFLQREMAPSHILDGGILTTVFGDGAAIDLVAKVPIGGTTDFVLREAALAQVSQDPGPAPPTNLFMSLQTNELLFLVNHHLSAEEHTFPECEKTVPDTFPTQRAYDKSREAYLDCYLSTLKETLVYQVLTDKIDSVQRQVSETLIP